MDEASALLLMLHGRLLRALCAQDVQDFAGLAQAARHYKQLSTSQRRRLRELDAVSGWLRHINQAKANQFFNDISAAIGAPALPSSCSPASSPPTSFTPCLPTPTTSFDIGDDDNLSITELNFCPELAPSLAEEFHRTSEAGGQTIKNVVPDGVDRPDTNNFNETILLVQKTEKSVWTDTTRLVEVDAFAGKPKAVDPDVAARRFLRAPQHLNDTLLDVRIHGQILYEGEGIGQYISDILQQTLK